jgi:hypothetical protein
MTNSLAKYKVHVQNGKVCEGPIKSPGRPKYLSTEDEIRAYLVTKGGVAGENLRQAELDINNAIVESLQEQENVQSIEDIIIEFNVFKNFYIYEKKDSKTSPIYYYKDEAGNTVPVGLVNQMKIKDFINFLNSCRREETAEFVRKAQKAINPKNPTAVSPDDVLERAYNLYNPASTLPRIIYEKELHPAVLDGYSVPALNVIPFIKKDIKFEDLHPLLQDLMSRMTDHEYFCAHLFTNLIGIKTPCLLYILGVGGSGKSSLVRFLSSITYPICNYDGAEKFNYFNMYGKSLIIQNENKYLRILQHTVLKSVTGGDPVPIEQKGKDTYTAEIRGQLIIIGNDAPKIIGSEDESRRLRYFKLKALQIPEDDRIPQDEYQDILSAYKNEFLNYCRMCYENLKTARGFVKYQPTHKEIIKNLRDPDIQNALDTVMDDVLKIKKTHKLDPEGRCDVSDLSSYRKKYEKSDKYFYDNFDNLLEVDYGITKENSQYIGITRKERRV